MGHPEKLSEMPFLVPFDSAFFLVILIFLSYFCDDAFSRKLAAYLVRRGGVNSRTRTEINLRITPPFTRHVHLPGNLLARTRERGRIHGVFFSGKTLSGLALSAPTPMQLFCRENRRVVVAKILELSLKLLEDPRYDVVLVPCNNIIRCTSGDSFRRARSLSLPLWWWQLLK